MAAAVDAQGVALVDCTRAEEEQAAATALVVGMVQGGPPLMAQWEGMANAEEVDDVVRCCMQHVAHVGAVVRGSLSQC